MSSGKHFHNVLCLSEAKGMDIIMTYDNREDQFLRQRLQKEIPILRALIQNLYQKLDRKFHLNGAKIPITFGFDTDSL